jgi:3-deoxy-manno-octulosonate cytidylyltransferase (CMP-KDO synthetase)
VVELLERDPDASMATVATPIHDEAIYHDPSCVKVVLSQSGRALYFSRSPIPLHRDGPPADGPLGLLHLGLYAYRRDFLLGLASLPPSPLERIEKLEQLRVLESGQPIAVGVVDERCVGIDTPEDYRRFVERWNARNASAA